VGFTFSLFQLYRQTDEFGETDLFAASSPDHHDELDDHERHRP
jgi:hypothetical protein